MPNRNINDNDPNPIQQRYDQILGGLDKAEGVGNVDGVSGAGKKSGAGDIRTAEESPTGNWGTNVVGPSSQIKSGGLMTFVKKKSPALAIIITLLGGLVGFGVGRVEADTGKRKDIKCKAGRIYW